MFEKDSRKHTLGKKSPKAKKSSDGEEPNTVYGELKLSEKLSLEMIAVRKQNESMMEQIEALTDRNQNLEKSHKTLQSEYS